MQGQEIRERYPQQWLLLEAIDAHSSEGQRILEDLAVLETYPDGMSAMNGYRELHRRDPRRELYILHTDREALEVTEVHWWGINPAKAPQPERDTFLDLAGDLAGRLEGPGDLSHNKKYLDNYGR